jgi:hypothetical protein
VKTSNWRQSSRQWLPLGRLTSMKNTRKDLIFRKTK